MDERIWTNAIGEHVGEEVRLAGWLHRFRRLSNVSFLILRDARGLAQVIVEDPAVAEALGRLYHESVLEVVGTATANPQAPGGGAKGHVAGPLHQQGREGGRRHLAG